MSGPWKECPGCGVLYPDVYGKDEYVCSVCGYEAPYYVPLRWWQHLLVAVCFVPCLLWFAGSMVWSKMRKAGR